MGTTHSGYIITVPIVLSEVFSNWLFEQETDHGTPLTQKNTPTHLEKYWKKIGIPKDVMDIINTTRSQSKIHVFKELWVADRMSKPQKNINEFKLLSAIYSDDPRNRYTLIQSLRHIETVKKLQSDIADMQKGLGKK